MKKTDKISYHQKSKAELVKLLTDLKKKLVETRTKHLTGNYEIALVSTLIKQND